MKNLLSLTICLIALSYFTAFAHFPISNQSPHFIVTSGEAKMVEKFALLSTKVNVSIAGTVADVIVEQIYVNRGDFPIEAVYVFPASTRAAVYGMTMYVGAREIVAVCKRKETARQEYETAKKEGKRASLLEQFKPNVFQMNVANIMPGDTIKTVMKYVENISAEAGEYEFVYPCVVGPRYTGSGLKENDQFVHNADQSAVNAITDSKFDITVNLLAGMKIMQIYSESHKINVENGSNPDAINTSAKITLDESAKIPNKDFILKYSLEDFKIQTGLIINKNQKENFFSLTLEPPSRVQVKDIPAREYIFILDVSGSMDGFPLETSKKTILKIIDGLRAEDKFNVVFFAGGSESMFCESTNANDFTKKIAHRKIDSYYNGGGTELMNALKQAFSIKKAEGYSRTIAILTDGFVTVEEEAFDFIKNNLDGANFFSLGIGGSVNRFLIEGMARIGLGEPFIVEAKENADEIAEKFLTYIQNPIMTDIKVEFEGIMAQDIVPEKIPDLFADRPITVFGKYEGQAGGKFKVSGMYKGEKLQVEIPVLKFGEFDESQALKYLWVRSKIAELDDYSGLVRNGSPKAKKIEEEVTVLGEKYNLLTKYTSFIAVDEVVANKPSDDDDINPMAPTQKSAPARASKSKSGKVDATAVGSVKSLGGDESLNQVIGMSAGVTRGGDGFAIQGQNPSGFANVEVIDRASASGGVGEDVGALSSNIDFTTDVQTVKVQTIEKEPDVNAFEAVEKEPVVDMQQILQNVVYPEMAKRASIEGKVVVKVLIGKTGQVEKCQIASSDNDMLNKAALDAIKTGGRFQPAIQNGAPVSCWINIPIIFNLKNGISDLPIKISNAQFATVNTEAEVAKIAAPPNSPAKPDVLLIMANIVLPDQAISAKIQTNILVNIHILSTGIVSEIKIDSSDNHSLDSVVIRAIQKTYSFPPAYLNGKPIDSWIKVPIKIIAEEYQKNIYSIRKEIAGRYIVNERDIERLNPNLYSNYSVKQQINSIMNIPGNYNPKFIYKALDFDSLYSSASGYNFGQNPSNNYINPSIDFEELSKKMNLDNLNLEAGENSIRVSILINKLGEIKLINIHRSFSEEFNAVLIKALTEMKNINPVLLNSKPENSLLTFYIEFNRYNKKIIPKYSYINNSTIILTLDPLKKRYDYLANEIDSYNSEAARVIKSIKSLFLNDFDYSEYTVKTNKFLNEDKRLNVKFNEKGEIVKFEFENQDPNDLQDYIKSFLEKYKSQIQFNIEYNPIFPYELNLRIEFSKFNVPRLFFKFRSERNAPYEMLHAGEKIRITGFIVKDNCTDYSKQFTTEFKVFKEARNWYFENLINKSDLFNKRIKYNPKYMSHLFPELKGMENEDIELEIVAERVE